VSSPGGSGFSRDGILPRSRGVRILFPRIPSSFPSGRRPTSVCASEDGIETRGGASRRPGDAGDHRPGTYAGATPPSAPIAITAVDGKLAARSI
jgi:hypothetical protein